MAHAQWGRVTGINVSQLHLARAEATARSEGVSDRVSFRYGNAMALEFPDESFDAAMSIDVYAHLSDRQKGFRETAGVHRASTTRHRPVARPPALAALACCAIPLLIAVGSITGAGAVILEKTLLALAAGLVVAALSMWWLHHRRGARRAAAAGASCGCDSCGGS